MKESPMGKAAGYGCSMRMGRTRWFRPSFTVASLSDQTALKYVAAPGYLPRLGSEASSLAAFIELPPSYKVTNTLAPQNS